MRNLIIPKTEISLDWVNNNLDEKDFIVSKYNISIFFRYDFQKNDILTEINNHYKNNKI